MYDASLLTRRLSLGYHSGESTPSPRQGAIMLFISFFFACLMFPFSEFTITIILFYDIWHLHLSPNFILMLSIFAHLCENFVRVEPCLDLFWFFYTGWSVTGPTTGSCGVCLCDGAANSYIEVGLKSSWSGWREDWFYLPGDNSLDNLCVPSTPA